MRAFGMLVSTLILYQMIAGATPVARETILENGFIRVSATGCRVTSFQCDPAGRGRYGPNKLLEMSFADLHETNATRLTHDRDRLRMDNLQAVEPQVIEVKGVGLPDRPAPGGSLGQSFTFGSGRFTRVEVQLPTWSTTDSQATLRLRRGAPAGEVIAQRRLDNVPDNSWQELTFAPQGPGAYYIELGEPRGMIGWWSSPARAYTGGQAFVNGQPVSDRDRALRVHGERIVGDASTFIELKGPWLKIGARVLSPAGETQHQFPLLMDVVWDNDGYDVSARSVPFYRFFTDNMRYMPVQQLKRWKERDGWYELSFDGCHWIQAESTDNYNLRFNSEALRLEWHLRGKDTVLKWTPALTTTENATQSEVTIEVRPKDDSIPSDWPRFILPDKRETDAANTFLWERDFTFGPVWGPAAWHEWMPLARCWQVGQHFSAIRQQFETYPMSGEGYVHTWGGSPGWPFPDNSQYDTRHFDTNARFVLGSWRYASWTGDREFLRRQADRIRKAMEYQLTTLHGEDGLIITASKDVTGRHKGVGDNYWDILPFGHLDAYANVVWYASLEAMAEIEEMLAETVTAQGTTPARSPAFYRDLARKARLAYNRTFWDDEKGRYIGCVDVDGKRHDYGFTFINLEAMAYGLANEKQVRRIYEWMETEPTSTGKPDTYSAFIFAPRATTLHNPRWNPEKGSIEPAPQEPWWHFGWLGTPFGDQCQDGGAILYTSFFDLLARARYLDPDNAWRRWEEILGRWRMPDHLCGGPPLYRGEQPQQINPGATGTDIPFPESGLVPCWLLYGVLGVNATSKGLEIEPRLPKRVPWVEARNVAYRGLPLNIRVGTREVVITCRATGYHFTWRAPLPPGGRVIFTNPPAPVYFPKQPLWEPASTWQAQWIWDENKEAPHACFRYRLELPASPKKAWLCITADDGFVLYVNGRRVASGSNWHVLSRVNLTRLLRKGSNIIAVAANNTGGPGGLVAQGEVVLSDGVKKTIATGRSWRMSSHEDKEWLGQQFDDATWQAAVEYGQPPCVPWQYIGEPSAPG